MTKPLSTSFSRGDQTEYSQSKCTSYLKAGISSDSAFFHRIRESRFSGNIHSIFERTINVRCKATDELYTIASSRVDNAPNTLITEVSSFSVLGLVVGEEVFAENDQLYIGTKLSISIKELTVWQSSLSIFPKK